MAWDDRFKKASAAKRQAGQQQAPMRFDDAVLAAARVRSPESYLRRHFVDLVVDKKGQRLAVPKVLRADMKEGIWVACDWFANPIGDNLALVMWTQHIGFVDAVHEFTGVDTETKVDSRLVRLQAKLAVTYPRLPSVDGVEEGRDYLRGRGISDETVAAAEAQGAIRFSKSGVLFLGRDLSVQARSVRSATVRYFEPIRLDDGSVLTKRDFENSDKAFPVVFEGDHRRVVITEGGVNALAVRDLSRIEGGDAPLIVASGGVGVRKWVTMNGQLSKILSEADRVEIWAENEVDGDGQPDLDKQSRTDALRQKLAEAIAEVRQGEIPSMIYPPGGAKDAADWNLLTSLSAKPGHHRL